MGGQNNGKISGWMFLERLTRELEVQDHGKAMGLPSHGADDSGQRTRRSLSFQVSWQPCPLLPPSESQPRPAGEIPSEARAKVLWVCVCVCVCVCVLVVYMYGVLYTCGVCMSAVCCTCVHAAVYRTRTPQAQA